MASAVVVSSFVCLLNCVLKWTHSNAMLGENGRGEAGGVSRHDARNIVYGPRIMKKHQVE